MHNIAKELDQLNYRMCSFVNDTDILKYNQRYQKNYLFYAIEWHGVTEHSLYGFNSWKCNEPLALVRHEPKECPWESAREEWEALEDYVTKSRNQAVTA